MASQQAVVDCIQVLEEIVLSKRRESGNSESKIHASDFFGIATSLLLSGGLQERTDVLLKVLVAILPNTSENLVQSYYKPLCSTIVKLLQSAEDNRFEASCLKALGLILTKQDLSEGFWNSLPALQCVNIVLSYFESETPLLRKTSFEVVHTLFIEHAKHNSTCFRNYFTDFAINVFADTTRASYRRGLCIIVFLESNLSLIPESKIKKLVEAALKLQSCDIGRLSTAVFRMIDGCLQSPQAPAAASLKLLNLLLANAPRTADVECNCHYLSSLASGFVLSLKNGGSLGTLPVVLQVLAAAADSEFTQVHNAMTTALKRIIFTCPQEIQALSAITSMCTAMLSLSHRVAWVYILDVLRCLLSVLRPLNQRNLCLMILRALGDAYVAGDNQAMLGMPPLDTAILESLSSTTGIALHSVGVKDFLATLPIIHAQDQQQQQKSVSRIWVLSILEEHLLDTPTISFADFVLVILPLAKAFHLLPRNHRSQVLRVWGLFSIFCASRLTDIASSFPRLIPILEKAVTDEEYPELLFLVAQGLGQLARQVELNTHNTSTATADKAVLTQQAPQVMPLLLRAAEGIALSDSKHREVLQSIGAWLRISSPQLVIAVTKQLLTMVLTSTTAAQQQQSDDAMEVIDAEEESDLMNIHMAVLLVTIPIAPESIAQIIYRTARPLVTLTHTAQKRAYQLLYTLLTERFEVIASVESPVELLQLLSESIMHASVASRNMRLKCLHALLAKVTDEALFNQACVVLLPEVILCLKDSNRKTRQHAIDLLHLFAGKLRYDTILNCCVQVIDQKVKSLDKAAGITAIQQMLVALQEAVRNAQDEDAEHPTTEEQYAFLVQNRLEAVHAVFGRILAACSPLMRQQSPDQTKAILGLLKTAIVMSNNADTMMPYLPQVLRLMLVDIGEIKPKYAAEIRATIRKLLRKFDSDTLRPLLPIAEDVALLDYLDRLERKQLRRRMAGKKPVEGINMALGIEDGQEDDGDEDDDEDDDEMELDRGAATLRTSRTIKSIRIPGENLRSMASRYAGSVASRTEKISVDDDEGVTGEEVEDYRLQPRKRFKATRAGSVASRAMTVGGRGPRSLADTNTQEEELFLAGFNGSNAGGKAIEDAFELVFTAEGQLVVKQREQDSISLHTGGAEGLKANNGLLKSGGGTRVKTERGSVRSAQQIQQQKDKEKKRKFRNLRDPGAEYRSKKAGGDVMKKGMAVQPHAFIPLDPRLLSKKHQATAIEHFGKVVNNNSNNTQQQQQRRKLKAKRGSRK